LPTVTEVADDSLKIEIDENGNPAHTRFAVAVIDCTGAYSHIDFRRHPRVLRTGAPSKDSTFHFAVKDSVDGVTVGYGVGKWYNVVVRALSGN
jgi:hypothetical protein